MIFLFFIIFVILIFVFFPFGIDKFLKKKLTKNFFYKPENKELELNQFSETHHIIGAHTNGIDITKYDFPKKSVLVFGNEAHGMSDVNKKKIKEFIKIKKRGVGESLNIATAASIVMHMIKRD